MRKTMWVLQDSRGCQFRFDGAPLPVMWEKRREAKVYGARFAPGFRPRPVIVTIEPRR
jgi:hypothetical protein